MSLRSGAALLGGALLALAPATSGTSQAADASTAQLPCDAFAARRPDVRGRVQHRPRPVR